MHGCSVRDHSRVSCRTPRKSDVSQFTLSGGAIRLNPYMDTISILPQTVSNQTASYADACIGGFGAYAKQNKSFARYVACAIQALHENDLVPPDEDHITLIVESALAVQSLFFAPCLRRPEQAELHHVFEEFVVSCVMPPAKWSNP